LDPGHGPLADPHRVHGAPDPGAVRTGYTDPGFHRVRSGNGRVGVHEAVAVVVVETGRAQVLGGIAQELADLVGVGDTCTIHQGHDACHVGSGEGSTLLIGVGVAPADDVCAQDAVGLAVAGVAARRDYIHLRPVVGIPRQPLAAVHRPDGDDVRVGGRHGHPPAVVAGARHEHDAFADRVLDLLVDEGVVV